ncbi:hypothetical protein [Cohnella sp. GCM10027633]|uniref:hypothetical protein n=1 Tax=unclassified Cohnella TaxID=2636738 RepID=UPI00362CBF4E
MPRPRSNAISGGKAPFVGAKPSKAPAIGSHRARAPIGGHRTPPMLSLQQSIGNQATQGVMSQPSPYADITDVEESVEQEAEEQSVGSQATRGSVPESAYSDITDEEESPEYDAEQAPETHGYMETASTPPSLPEGYGAYSKPVPPSLPPRSEPGADEGVFYSTVEEEGGGMETELDSSPGGGSGSGGSYGVYGAHSEHRPLPSLPQKPQRNGLEMESNKMGAFDTEVLGGGIVPGVELASTTFYANEEQRAKYGRGFDESGHMTNKTDGSQLSTIGAEKGAVRGSKADRHIFVMDGEGGFHTNDVIKENKGRSKQIKDQRKDEIRGLADEPEKQQMLRGQQLPNMERFHHTSFLAGEDVAGAGELQVRDGQVELVSDASGHYQPESRQMMQTVQQLENNHVPVEQLGVEFIGKPQFESEIGPDGQPLRDEATGKKILKRDEHGNKVKQLGGDGLQAHSKNMQASALELLGYANHSPDTAEEQMRESHGKKDAVLQELLSKTKRVEPISGGVHEKHDNVMQELLAKTPRTAPIAGGRGNAPKPDDIGQYHGTNDIFDVHNVPESLGYREIADKVGGDDDSDYSDDQDGGGGTMDFVDAGYGSYGANEHDGGNGGVSEEFIDRGYDNYGASSKPGYTDLTE